MHQNMRAERGEDGLPVRVRGKRKNQSSLPVRWDGYSV
jgi:hypothetical protein